MVEPKPRYICYLNGKAYGMGDLDYMRELFIDYVVTCEMYGREQVDFTIKRQSAAKETII